MGDKDDEPQPKRSRDDESSEEKPLPKGWEKRLSRTSGKYFNNSE